MQIEWDDPRIWVALAFAIFFLLSFKKVAAFLTRALDERSAKIKSELDEARRLREEAQAILDDYRSKQADAVKEAEAILAGARKDADSLRAYTEKELKSSLDTRMKQAVDRIDQEEAKAISDVRNHVVDIALSAARSLITEHIGTMSQDELVKLAVADIERKIH